MKSTVRRILVKLLAPLLVAASLAVGLSPALAQTKTAPAGQQEPAEMAVVQVNFVSHALQRRVPLQVLLPVSKSGAAQGKDQKVRPLKTLYLLHGVFGSNIDWLVNTRIKKMAEAKNLCVIMPSGDNSFYVDNPKTGNNYGQYIGEELVAATRKMFNLSHEREDTFIAGLSIGGYGAIEAGLKYPETFGYAAGLSSALVLEPAFNIKEKSLTAPLALNKGYFETIFGDLDAAARSEVNPRVLVEELKQKQANGANVQFPKLYLACGVEDSYALPLNRGFKQFLAEKNVPITYEEGSGGHDWTFWNTYIGHVLDWLPLG